MRLPVHPALALSLAVACGGGGSTQGGSPPPTFHRDVEPILQTRCAGCHAEGGLAPFALAGYEDARARASLLADVVERRVMPPWPPSDRGVPLRYSRALTDEQIATISAWARAGAPRGDPEDHRDRAPEVPSIRADLTLEMAEPYTPDASGEDDYRCFVVDPGAAAGRTLTGYDVAPGTPGVHHVILFLVLPDGLARLAALDAADAGYGYGCFGATGVEGAGGAASPVRTLGGWAPGAGASPLPAGTGLAIPAGSRLVLQVHYHTARSVAPDLTRVALELSEGEGLAPAALVPLAQTAFSVPPGARAHVVEAREVVPVPATLYGAFPHMHLHGTAIAVSVERASGERVLVDIPRWDFDWQGGYEFVAPERLAPGDAVKVRCTFDNSSGTAPLTWGEGTADEMCLAFLYVGP